MRNTMKVAKWEIKRNMKNKSFIISLFLTPLIFIFFAVVPGLFSDSDDDVEPIDVFVKDELQIVDEISAAVEQNEFLNWKVQETELDEESVLTQVENSDRIVYIPLTSTALDEGLIDVYTSEDIEEEFMNQIGFIEEPLRQQQFEKLGLSAEELEVISRGLAFESHVEGSDDAEEEAFIADPTEDADFFKRLIPSAFAGIILFSIVISGMMIFQSASQEKKDKIAEIILSSVTPNELMQGKIMGYFVLGLIQVTVWLGIGLPVALWKIDLPLFEYLLVPELVVLLTIAILGYLLFASIFVGLGATMEDASSTGNFQGLVLMLPFLPFILLGPVLSDPAGTVAKVGSYIPFTSPGIFIIRLSTIEEWPWMDIIIGIVILIISVWIFMKLAGKIFRTGILMYGKNATPKEIWRWLWAKE